MPFEPMTESQGHLVTLLEAMLERAKAGDITAFFWVAENTDGEYEQGLTPMEDVNKLAGMAMFSLMRHMGFLLKTDIERDPEDGDGQ